MSVTVTSPPAGVNFSALNSTFLKTCCRRSPSRSHAHGLGGVDEPHSDVFLLGDLGRRFNRAADDVGQAVDLQIERQFAARGAIQLEKVFDQPELEEGVALDHLDRAGDLSRDRFPA